MDFKKNNYRVLIVGLFMSMLGCVPEGTQPAAEKAVQTSNKYPSNESYSANKKPVKKTATLEKKQVKLTAKNSVSLSGKLESGNLGTICSTDVSLDDDKLKEATNAIHANQPSIGHAEQASNKTGKKKKKKHAASHSTQAKKEEKILLAVKKSPLEKEHFLRAGENAKKTEKIYLGPANGRHGAKGAQAMQDKLQKKLLENKNKIFFQIDKKEIVDLLRKDEKAVKDWFQNLVTLKCREEGVREDQQDQTLIMNRLSTN